MTEKEVYKLIEIHYRQNFKRLVNYMARRVRSRYNAEDVVQEAYTNALEYWNSFNGECFDNWFRTILHNAGNDFMNTEIQSGINYRLNIVEVAGPNPAHYGVMLKDIVAMIDAKPDDIKEVLSLYFLSQYKQREVAKVTPKSRKAVEHIVIRFRQEIYKVYGKKI